MKYTIMHVDDRAKDNMEQNKLILKDFDYVDGIDFFNGNSGKAWDVLNHLGIKQDVWSPYDGRTSPPLPGELGVWVSTINTWKYMIGNSIDQMLVIEDDVRLSDDFVVNLSLCLQNLPNNFDFLSLYYFEAQNWAANKTDIGSEYIHRSTNQYSAAQAMVYSSRGAKNLIKLVKRFGIEYTTDCFIFQQARLGYINGYSVKPSTIKMLDHLYTDIKSLIDPDNTRKTDML